MQRNAFKPQFTRSRKTDSLLPSVVVLPKISVDREAKLYNTESIPVDHLDLDQLTSSELLPDFQRTPKTSREPTNTARKSSLQTKSLPELPPTPFKTSFVDRKEKKDQKMSHSMQTNERRKYLSTSNEARDPNERKQFGMVTGTSLLEKKESRRGSVSKAKDAFEEPTIKDFWPIGKYRDAGLSRRESACSSCGGALSYSNSFASTRRFSTVSIEVPSENFFMKKSSITRSTPFIGGESTAKSHGSRFVTTKREDYAEMDNRKSHQAMIDRVNYDRVSKQRNFLYDLISVLYKKNFVKEEIQPYVRHALKICGDETPD